MEGLQDIIEGFDFLEPADRLELLIEYGRQLPPLPETLHALRDAGEYIVHECQAPVFMKVNVVQDQLSIHADAPVEAPIARGFIAILVLCFNNRPVSMLRTLPENILKTFGLDGLLGMQRTLGLTAIYNRIKAAIVE